MKMLRKLLNALAVTAVAVVFFLLLVSPSHQGAASGRSIAPYLLLVAS